MTVADLPVVFHWAQRLSNREELGLTSGEQAECIRHLTQHLSLKQGVPTALGSGRMGLPHKMAAVAHSCRLQLSSWAETALWLSCTASWTGDLGAESGVGGFCRSLTEIIGPWVRAADLEHNEGDAPGDEPAD
eukprot:3238106-Alexandrium_andersonii.AAC.1